MLNKEDYMKGLMRENMNIETAKKAAKWWRDKIESRPVHDNGATDSINMMAMLLANITANKMNVTSDQFDEFEEILSDIIMEYPYTRVSLGCDYYPDKILKEAADLSAIPLAIFPYKTYMDINKTDDAIYVKDGYGKEYVRI